MSNRISQILDADTYGIIEILARRQFAKDETYQYDLRDLSDLADRIQEFAPNKTASYIIEDYQACQQTVMGRAVSLAYLTAVTDVLSLLAPIIAYPGR